MKSVKSRRGKTKFSVDPGVLVCEHHAFMSIGVNFLMKEDGPKEILVVGLGGGSLGLFLHHLYQKLKILAVDIDENMLKIATNWFDFVQDERTKVKIADGIEFLKGEAEGKKFDAVLFDIDNKDSTVGMSFPPKEFLEPSVLSNVSKCLNADGLFIVNFVCRDKTLRPKVLENLNKTFASVTSMKIENILNEVMICSNLMKNEEEWKNEWKESVKSLNEKVKSRKLLAEDLVDTIEVLNGLTIES